MIERTRAPISKTLEEVKAVLPNFKETYMNRSPVIGAGLGMERSPRGKERFVFRVYLEQEPTEEQQRSLKKTFRGIPIKYKVTGSIVTAGGESSEVAVVSASFVASAGEVPIQYGPEARWADPALQNFERWLTAHGADPVVAQSATEDIWIFEAYKVVPYIGKPSPISLAAQEGLDNKYDVWVYIPTPSEKPKAATELSESFQELTGRNKTGSVLVFPTYHLEFIPDDTDGDIEAKVQELALKHGRDFLGVYRYNLEGDLHTVMSPEVVSPWLDSPNTLTGGRKPREILGTDEEWIIRDMIMNVRHGSFS